MIIGLTGKIGVGKSAVAEQLCLNNGFVTRTYAYPIKLSLAALTGLPLNTFIDPVLKEQKLGFGKSPREMMQLMGTEFVRNMVYHDFYVWRMKQTLSKIGSEVHVVIDDCRFENEAMLIRDQGGVVIHLRRTFESPTTQTAHISEQVLDVWSDDIVINSGRDSLQFTLADIYLHLKMRGTRYEKS